MESKGAGTFEVPVSFWTTIVPIYTGAPPKHDCQGWLCPKPSPWRRLIRKHVTAAGTPIHTQLEDYAIPRLLDRYFERIGNSDT